MAKPPSISVKRGGSAVADNSTGAEEQEGERVLQAAGEEQQHRQFGDIEGQQPGGAVGLEPLRHVEAQPQRHIEPGRQRDHRQAGPDRQLEIEPGIDHQHRGGLPDDGEPAQPHQRVEAHIAARMILGEAERGHGGSCNAGAAALILPAAGHMRAACLCAGGRGLRSAAAASHLSRAWTRKTPPPSPSTAWSSSTRAWRRSTASRFACRRLDHRPARRQRRRQDHDHRHDHGPGHAHLRHGHGAGRRHAERALPRAAPDEFRKPLCRHADAAHRAAESVGVRPALRGRRYRRAHRRARRRSRSRRISRPADRQALGRAEDARLARQGAAQQAGSAAARRADRLARSRHRRLGARPARALSPGARRDRAARLAQHERGRAAVRARHHHEDGPHRGRRHAGASA